MPRTFSSCYLEMRGDEWRKERGRKEGETEKRNFSVDNHLYEAMPDVGDSTVLAPGQTGQWTDKQLEAFGKCLL